MSTEPTSRPARLISRAQHNSRQPTPLPACAGGGVGGWVRRMCAAGFVEVQQMRGASMGRCVRMGKKRGKGLAREVLAATGGIDNEND